MAEPLRPNFWVHANLTKYPESAGTNALYASNTPLADEIFKEGRVRAMSEIVRAMSDMNGSPVRSRATVEFNDEDSWFRTLLADAQGQYLEMRELAIFHQSEQGRKNGGTPDQLFTGVIRESTLSDPMGAGLTLDDWLMSQRSPFSASKKLLANRKLTRDLFPQLPKDSINRTQRVIIGEQSDANLKNPAGESVAKGAVEGVYVGGFFITSDGSPIPDGLTPTYMGPPSNVTLSVVGTPGTRTVTIAVSAITLTGETVASTAATITNAPNILDDVNYVHVEWAAPTQSPDQVIAYRVLGPSGTSTYLELTTNNGVYVNPETAYNYGPKSVTPKSYAVPPVSTAVIQVVIPGVSAVTAEVWQGFFLCGHAVNPDDMHQLFGPVWETTVTTTTGEDTDGNPTTDTVIEEGEPYRAALEEGVFGVDVLAPGRPGWPYSTPYIDVTDVRTGKVHRVTMFFARGSRAHYAIAGKAGFAWNMCGIEENGDGSGEAIRKAYFAQQWVLSELAAANDGEGYYSGLYAGLPYFKHNPSLAMIDTDAVQACQDYTIERVGGIGYAMDTIIDKEISVVDFITKFNQQYESWTTIDRFGQHAPRILRIGETATSGNHYREGETIRRMTPPEISYADIENRQLFQYRYYWPDEKYINDAEQLDHVDSQGAYYGGARESPLLGLDLIGDRVTARDAMARRRFRKAYQSVYQEIVTDNRAIRQENGDTIFITHRRGLGANGYQDAPFVVVQVRVSALMGEVTLRGFYLGRYEGLLAPVLGDSTDPDYSFILGDSTSPEPPPVGAYRLS